MKIKIAFIESKVKHLKDFVRYSDSLEEGSAMEIKDNSWEFALTPFKYKTGIYAGIYSFY